MCDAYLSDVRYGPIADMRHSSTSSARASTDSRCRAQCFRGLEVDHELIFGWRLHRQVGWLLGLEDAIDIAGGTPILVDVTSPIGDQTAGGDEDTFVIDRRQFVPSRQLDDQIAMTRRGRARRHDQATAWRAAQRP